MSGEKKDAKPLNLFQRINAIRAEVRTVAKDAQVSAGQGSYAAVTHDAVTRMVRPLMVKHGVVSLIQPRQSEMVDTGTNWGKRKLFQYRGQFLCTLVNTDNPDECIEMRIEAHADESGDKAPGKALSYAAKSFYLKVFAIETGEDDEVRVDDAKLMDRVDTLTEQQLIDLSAKAEELFGDDADSVLDSMAKNVFRKDSYVDIETKHFGVAIKKLEAKAQAEQ